MKLEFIELKHISLKIEQNKNLLSVSIDLFISW